ncbi:MAG TPA: MoxR family ATPase [Thermoanaerobaculia bacterium]|nr:MoxR family ATPase [Thermoanaerobaculia bacterium]
MRYLEWDPARPEQKLPPFGALPEGVHVFNREPVDAVNAALAARRPLLVRGEPGTGKSQLARAAAAGLGRPLVATAIDGSTEARDLLWSLDAVSRLAEAQIQGALGVRDSAAVRANLREERFLAPGPLWWAFDWADAARQAAETGQFAPPTPEGWSPADGVVVLLDEIDKADSSVPNGLLECLGHGRFACPGGRSVCTQPGQAAPLIVLTTNEERALPAAFLRRCLVLQLGWPQEPEELVGALVRWGRAHFPAHAPAVLDRAARRLAADRQALLDRDLVPPGGAEYLDLLRALGELAPGHEEGQLELLERLAVFTFAKHAAEPAG